MIKTGLTLKRANEQIEEVQDQYVLARQYDMAVNHRGALHSHAWYQLMYASSGLLNVEFADQFMVVPPHKAIWLPPDHLHQVVAPTGAKFRSLYFRPDQVVDLGEKSKVFTVFIRKTKDNA